MELAIDMLDEDQKKLFYKAKAFKQDPQSALLDEAEIMIDPKHREQFKLVKKMIQTYQSGGSMDGFIPEQYKGYVDTANVAIEKAKEIKKKKDEL